MCKLWQVGRCVLVVALVCMAERVVAREDVRAVTFSAHVAIDSCHMNMGPTGARAWMRGYHFVVARIDSGSPAAGVLELGDVVVAAGGIQFGPDADPRMTLGNAIGEAEATGRPLRLHVMRRGRRRKVSVRLPETGPFSPTWPSDCAKSARILDRACRSILNAQMPDGSVPTDGSLGTFLGGLLLLASGQPEYLDGARRAAYNATTLDYSTMGTKNWALGYSALLMAEYYLATGDDTVLEKLEENTAYIVSGQMACGTWGHNTPAGGYGALNQPGIVCAMALILARECGVSVDEQAIDAALDFFARYAHLGSVPYGDHGPGRWPDDNGRNATSAILMKLAGRDDEASAFSRSVAMSYWMREEGHTGGFFSISWGPMGAMLAGDDAFRTFMDYQKWYYNLARTWKGELTILPYHEALTRFDDSAYIDFGGDFTTGGIGLVFAMPAKRLRILGAPHSVFGAKLDGPLAAARDAYTGRDWKACDAALTTLEASSLSSEEERRWLAQLKTARVFTQDATDRVLIEIDSNLLGNACYRAREQYDALTQALGAEGDPRFADFDARFEAGSVPWYTRENKRLYDEWSGLKTMAFMGWIPNGVRARQFIEGLPYLRPPVWEPLSPTGRIVPQLWRTVLLADDEELPRGWADPDFDDSGWREEDGIFTRYVADNEDRDKCPNNGLAARRVFQVDNPVGNQLRIELQTVRVARTQVYLNGELIVDVERGKRGGYAPIILDDSVKGLLKPGENLLAVTSTKQGGANNHLDVGLSINRVAVEQRTLPVRRIERAYHEDLPEGDHPLRVRETKDRYLDAMKASYAGQSTADLLDGLGNQVPFVRGLIEDELVARGEEGIRAVFPLAEGPDWTLRSVYCNVMIKAADRLIKAEKDGEEVDSGMWVLLREQIPMLTERVADKHYWVRSRAATALPLLGEEAAGAVPVLSRYVLDSDKWVRGAVIQAIGTLSADSGTAVVAALQIMSNPGSSYGPPAAALKILEDYPEVGEGRLEALLTFMRNPPQGFGKRVLGPIMDMAAELDPDGETVIPVLIDAASDTIRYSGQRGNARGKAIEMLGDYGEKAAAAVPALEAILASEEKKDVGQHEAVTEALRKIRGEPVEASKENAKK